jgi:hypothetical protein
MEGEMRLARWIEARCTGLMGALIGMPAGLRLGLWLAATAGLLLLWAALAWPAAAQEAWLDGAFKYRAYKDDLYWGRFHCGGRYRPEGCAAWRWRRWQARERARWEEDGPGAACLTRLPAVRGTSGQHNTEAASKRDAVFRWMLEAQAEHGSVYMNFNLATRKVWQCFQSQAHDTLGGKIVAGAGKLIGGEGYQVVCRLWASPCRAPYEREPDAPGDHPARKPGKKGAR